MRTQHAIGRAKPGMYVIWQVRTKEAKDQQPAQYTDYNADWTKILEENFAQNKDTMSYIPGLREHYTIDFKARSQTNDRTGTVRPIRRFLLTAEEAAAMELVESECDVKNAAVWDQWAQEYEAKKAKTQSSTQEPVEKKEDVTMGTATS